MKLSCFVRAKSGNGEQLNDAGRDFLTQLFKNRVSAKKVQPFDDRSNRGSDAWNGFETVGGNQSAERQRKCSDSFGGALVCPRAIWVPASYRASLGDLPEQGGNLSR